VASKIQALYIILTSLAYIGVSGAPIADMYVGNFIPALLGMFVFGAAGWYVFNLAKGRDYGRKFSMATAATGVVVVVALFITSLVVLHDGSRSLNPGRASDSPTMPMPGYDEDYYQDLLENYSR
jgi:hypothetical protein